MLPVDIGTVLEYRTLKCSTVCVYRRDYKNGKLEEFTVEIEPPVETNGRRGGLYATVLPL